MKFKEKLKKKLNRAAYKVFKGVFITVWKGFMLYDKINLKLKRKKHVKK
jgi:hypothetical protein